MTLAHSTERVFLNAENRPQGRCSRPVLLHPRFGHEGGYLLDGRARCPPQGWANPKVVDEGTVSGRTERALNRDGINVGLKCTHEVITWRAVSGRLHACVLGSR